LVEDGSRHKDSLSKECLSVRSRNRRGGDRARGTGDAGRHRCLSKFTAGRQSGTPVVTAHRGVLFSARSRTAVVVGGGASPFSSTRRLPPAVLTEHRPRRLGAGLSTPHHDRGGPGATLYGLAAGSEPGVDRCTTGESDRRKIHRVLESSLGCNCASQTCPPRPQAPGWRGPSRHELHRTKLRDLSKRPSEILLSTAPR